MSVNFITTEYITATGTAVPNRTRLSGMSVTSPAGGGDYVFRDGGSTGTIRYKMKLPGGMIEPYYVQFPDLGILFATDMYIEMPGGYLTIFHD